MSRKYRNYSKPEEVKDEGTLVEQAAEEAEEKPVYAIVQPKNGLNMRRTPYLTGDVVKVLEKGEKVEVDSISVGGWTIVTAKDGTTGYVMSEFIK